MALPSPAAAAPARRSLTVTPINPLDSQALHVSWRPATAPRAGYQYVAFFSTGDQSFSCKSDAQIQLKPNWKKGALVRFTLRPTEEPVWCQGDPHLDVIAITPAKRGVNLASMKIEIADNSSTPLPEPPGGPVKVTLLDGSSMTVRVPGRPDRTSAVTGGIDGRLLPSLRPGSDQLVNLGAGALSLSSLTPDPLCSSSAQAYPATVATVGGHPSLAVSKTREVYLTLVLANDPLGLTGCQGPASDPALRPIALAGRLGPEPDALQKGLTLSGSLAGVRLAEGVDATLLFTLNVKVQVVA